MTKVLDLQRLSSELDALPPGVELVGTTADGETLRVVTCPGGVYLPGDLAVSSLDVAEADPRHVVVV